MTNKMQGLPFVKYKCLKNHNVYGNHGTQSRDYYRWVLCSLGNDPAPELGLNDKLAAALNSQLKSCPLYILNICP